MSEEQIDMSGLAVQTPEGKLIGRITVFENQELASEATGKACTSIAEQLRVIKGLASYVPDLSTVAGDKEARQYRAMCVACRTGAEKVWKLAAAPITAVTKAGLKMVKDIEVAVREIEEPIDAAIKIEEDRKAQEKLAKQQAEAERVKKINDLLSVFRGWPASMIGCNSAEIREKITRCEKSVVNPDVFMEFTKEAELAKAASITQLQQLLDSTLVKEEMNKDLEAAQLAEEAKDKRIKELEAMLLERGVPTEAVQVHEISVESGVPSMGPASVYKEVTIEIGNAEAEAAALFDDDAPDKGNADGTQEEVMARAEADALGTPIDDEQETAELLSAVEDAVAYHDTIVEILAAAQNTQAFPNHMKFRAFVVTKCKEVLEG